MKPLVSVVIVSYNTRELTVKSIRSVFASSGFEKGEIEVIVVDNHSTDDTVKYLKKHFPQVKLIVNRVNRGFGGGNNQGAKLARGRYLLLLNTDAFLSQRALSVLVKILDKHSEFIAAGPQLRYADGRIQLSGGYLPTPWRVLGWMWWLDKLPLVKLLFPHPYHVFDSAWHTRKQFPEWLMGACVLFRRDEFLAAGGFDKEIFMYAEEVELFRRLKASLGKQVFFTPAVKVVHLGRASSKRANAFVLVHELKGIEYIYRKHYPRLLWLIKTVIFFGVLLRITVFSLLPGRREARAEYFQFFRQINS